MQYERFKKSGEILGLGAGVRFTLNFAYFSAKLWKNIQSHLRANGDLHTLFYRFVTNFFKHPSITYAT